MGGGAIMRHRGSGRLAQALALTMPISTTLLALSIMVGLVLLVLLPAHIAAFVAWRGGAAFPPHARTRLRGRTRTGARGFRSK